MILTDASDNAIETPNADKNGGTGEPDQCQAIHLFTEAAFPPVWYYLSWYEQWTQF